jgi:hypothetical protein
VYSLAPLITVTGGWVIAALLIALSVYVLRANRVAVNISTLLGILSIITSPLIPAHTGALLDFGSTPKITLLDTLQILGFYVFPTVFIVLRFTKLKTPNPPNTKK